MHTHNENTQRITHTNTYQCTSEPIELCGKRILQEEVLQLAAVGHRSLRGPDGSQAALMRGQRGA